MLEFGIFESAISEVPLYPAVGVVSDVTVLLWSKMLSSLPQIVVILIELGTTRL